MEVETPLLSAAAVTDPHLESFAVRCDCAGVPADGTLWLQTSPEYAMKRLLAAGCGSIYQIARAFRSGERGRRHNPEFTLLEWYRVGFDHRRLMDEVAELVIALLGPRPARRMTYRDAFVEIVGVDPFRASLETLASAALDAGIVAAGCIGADRDAWLDLILSHQVQPKLGQGELLFLTDFPASQAALARLCPDDPSTAERFELFVDGMELANGFHELTDPDEQSRRFDADRRRRQMEGRCAPAPDARLLAALKAGLPDCSGVALGFDRLMMVALGVGNIDETIAFPVELA